MPRVPVVPTVSTGLRALPTVQRGGVDPNPLGQLGGALQQAGGDLAQLVVQERRKADETRVIETDTTLSALATSMLTDPERGLFTKQGKNAIGSSEAALQSFDVQAAKALQVLTPEQRRMAQARVAAQRESLASSANRHELQQRQRYDVETAASALDVAKQAGLADVHNVQALGKAEGDIRASVERVGTLQGQDATTIAANTGKQVSGFFADAVATMLTRDELPQAEALFGAVKGKLVGDDLLRVEQAIQRGTLKVKGQTIAETAMKQFGGDRKKVNEYIRANSDGDLQDYAISQADAEFGRRRQEEAQQRMAVEQGKQRAAESIWTKVESGVPLSQNEWQFASQNGLRSRVEARMVQRFNGAAPETNLGTWTQLQQMDRQQTAQVNPAAYRGSLNEADYRALVQRVEAAKEQSGAVWIQTRSLQQRTEDAAREIGIVPKSGTLTKLPEDQAAMLREFQSGVDERLTAIREATGRNATPAQQADILAEMKMSVLTTDGGWLGRSRTVLASEVAPTDDGDYRVPLASIPKAYNDRYRTLIRSAAATAGVSNAAITDEMVSRAAALHARGGWIVPNMTADQSRAFWQQVSR